MASYTDQPFSRPNKSNHQSEIPITQGHQYPSDYFNIHCIANIKASNFGRLEPLPSLTCRKKVLCVSELPLVLTELIRLQTKVAVSVKVLWSAPSPLQKAVTSQGIFDVKHQKPLKNGTDLHISGFFLQDDHIIVVLKHGRAQLFRTPALHNVLPIVNTFCMTYAIHKNDIQHIKVRMSDRCAVFVVGQQGSQTVEEWVTHQSDRDIFHSRAQKRVQYIRDNLNPPSPKMYGGCIVDQLNRLSILHREGELTDSEFAKAKKMLF